MLKVSMVPFNVTMCIRCGSTLSLNGYCNNYKCPYSDWPQDVRFSDLIMMSVIDVEQKYNIKKRPKFADDKLSDHIQSWDKSKTIIHLESFINSYGLKRELMIYLQEITDRENSDQQ